MTVPHGVPVDVVKMVLEIFLVLDGMFPKPWLPDSATTLAFATSRNHLI